MSKDAAGPVPSDDRRLRKLAARQRQLLDERTRQIAELEQANQRIALQNQRMEALCRELEQKHVELEQRQAELEQRHAQRLAELELDKLRLKQQLLVAMKKLYGPRGDRLTSEGDVAQLLLEFAAALEAMPVEAAEDRKSVV